MERENRENQQNRTSRTKAKAAQKRRRIWLMILAIAIVAILCIVIFVIAPMSGQPEPVETPEITPSTAPTVVISPAPSASPAPTPTEPQILPQLAELYEQNGDLAGWIKIEGTEIDYPVMYTPEDGEFYLYRTFEGEEDPTKEGCLFIDEHCTIDPRSTNLLIHGHNMRNGSMFHTLLEYQDEDFYKEHPRIEYCTLYEEEEYEIVAAFLTKIYNKNDDVFKFYQFYNAENEEEFEYYIENIQKLALYDTGITPEYGDELITLATCEYSQENGRMVVVARKVDQDSNT